MPRPRVSYITQNAGRLCDSLPRPYVTHDPTHGKPMRLMPVFILKRAGEWLFESPHSEWMKAILSTCFAMCGNNSLTIFPHSPCFAHLNGDFMIGPTCPLK